MTNDTTSISSSTDFVQIIAVVLGMIISGLWLSCRAGFLNLHFNLYKRLKLKDKRGILVPSLVFVLSPFVLSNLFNPVTSFILKFGKNSSIGTAIFSTGVAIFSANVFLDKFKENQLKKKLVKGLIPTLEQHIVLLESIELKLSNETVLEPEEKLKNIGMEIASLNSNFLLGENLDKIMLFEVNIVDAIARHSSELAFVINTEKIFYRKEDSEMLKSRLGLLKKRSRVCRINADICLFCISVVYKKERFDEFKNNLKIQYRELRKIREKLGAKNPECLAETSYTYDNDIKRIEEVFKEFEVLDEIQPLIHTLDIPRSRDINPELFHSIQRRTF